MNNRIFKFRGWDTKKKKMEYDIGVFEEWPIDRANHTYDTPNVEIEFLEDVIIQQFTGLKDKNGKNIYEGDIISYKTLQGIKYQQIKFIIDQDNIGGVYISPLSAGDGCGCCASCLKGGDVEIVGNIYENPNLLNQ